MATLPNEDSWPTNDDDAKRNLERPLDILLGIHSRLDEILITGIIQHTCHRVHVVDSGLMALESLQNHAFDIGLLSYGLAELNGLETTQHIRATQTAWQHLPIIGILHQEESDKMAGCLQGGMNTILITPISAKKLMPILMFYQEKKALLF